MRKKRIGVLIGNIKDVGYLDDMFVGQDNVIWYANEYYVLQGLTDRVIHYLFPRSSSSAEIIEALYHFVENWHRDKSGNDLTMTHGVSHGQMIAQSLRVSLCNIYKNYMALQGILCELDVLYVSENESPGLLLVASSFGEKIKFYDSGVQKNYKNFYSATSYRTRYDGAPAIFPHWLSGIARFFQKFFLGKTRKKTLAIDDWTYRNSLSKNKCALVINSLLPWRSYYLKKPKKIPSFFSDSLDAELLDVARFQEILGRHRFCFDSAILSLFSREIQATIATTYENFNFSYACLRELLSYYKPKCVVIPGPLYYPYVIMLYLCKIKGIKTYKAIDGYFIILQSNDLLLDNRSKEKMFDYFFAYGGATRDLFLKNSIDADRIKLISPPILSHIVRYKVKIKYDVVILIPQYNPHNPNSRPDQVVLYLSDVVETIIQAKGSVKIAVKVKGSQDIINTIKEMDIAGSLTEVDFICGKMSECLGQSNTYVGQGNTSVIAELCHAGKDYYIYHPVELGIPDTWLYSSEFIPRDMIAISREQLKVNFESENKLIVDKDYLFSGQCISGFDFADLHAENY